MMGWECGECRLPLVSMQPQAKEHLRVLMQEKGLTRDGRLFALQYLLSEYKKDWKPGTYELSTAMTAEEMMEVMAGQTESATEETVETIDNGSAITGETQDTTAVAQ